MRVGSQIATAPVKAKADPKTGLDDRETKRLKDACKDFEALFLTNMLKAMRKTVQKTDLFGSDSGEETFQEMMDTEVGKSAAKSSSMGIADALYHQLATQMSQQNAENKTR